MPRDPITRITLRDVAQAAGVSPGTASRVLSPLSPGGRIASTTADAVRDAARRLGYRASAAGRSLRGRATKQVGLLVHQGRHTDPTLSHNHEFLLGVVPTLERSGYGVCLSTLPDARSNLNAVSRIFREQSVDALIVRASLGPGIRRRIGSLVRRCLWCDAGARDLTGCVYRNEEAAGRLVGEALRRAACRQAIFVQMPENQRQGYDHGRRRLAGLLDVAGRHDIRVDHLALSGDATASMEQLRPHLLGEQPLIASGYRAALRILAAALRHGRRPGIDFRVACCDDLGAFATLWPGLSRATYDRTALGARAADLMLAQLQADKPLPSLVDQPRWIFGETLSPA